MIAARRRWLVTLGLLNAADVGLSWWGGPEVEMNPVVRHFLESGWWGLMLFIGLKVLAMGLALWWYYEWDDRHLRVAIMIVSTLPVAFAVVWNLMQFVIWR